MRYLVAALFIVWATVAHAATLLPPGKACFYDSSGYALADGTVNFYIPSTTTPKTTWHDPQSAVANTNPVSLDSAGCAVIYGIGTYREVVNDVTGATVWDQLVASPRNNGVAWGANSFGTPNAQSVVAPDFVGNDGEIVAFIAGQTNTGATTLAIQTASFSIGTYAQLPTAVVKDSTGGPIPLSGGEFHTGVLLQTIYSTADGTFHLLGIPQAGSPPVTQMQIFTASGTWTKPVTGLTASSRAHLECWGAGGGGSQSAGGAGGGGYSDRWLAINGMGATESVTIGAGGAIGTGTNPGIVGGNSSFGSWLTAYGGGGGGGNAAGAGGGGETSVGLSPVNLNTGGVGGGPWKVAGGSGPGTNGQNSMSGGGGGTVASGSGAAGNGGAGYYGGGGGGASAGNNIGGSGGASVWGGAGGGGSGGNGHANGAGGTSLFGGAGGTGNIPGAQPGGGGSGGASVATVGGRGQCNITLFP